jgi:GGDEF domain-containing protein
VPEGDLAQRDKADAPDAGPVRPGERHPTHGHGAGDELLAEMADLLRTALGTAAVLGRIGGDEFAAVVLIVPLWHQIERVHDFLTDPFTTERGVEIGVQVVRGKFPTDLPDLR